MPESKSGVLPEVPWAGERGLRVWTNVWTQIQEQQGTAGLRRAIDADSSVLGLVGALVLGLSVT